MEVQLYGPDKYRETETVIKTDHRDKDGEELGDNSMNNTTHNC